MKYMILECHLGYAIALDNEGRFKKVANQNYQVGQTVNTVFELVDEKPHLRIPTRLLGALSSIAAVAIIAVLFILNPLNPSVFASVNLKINPEVNIELNKDNEVTNIKGVNSDGNILIENYNYQQKQLEPVMDELIQRAIDLGFLQEGGQISVTLDGEDAMWVSNATQNMRQHLANFMSDKVDSMILVGDKKTNDYQIVIPYEHPIVEDDQGDNEYDPEEPQPTTEPTPTTPVPPVDDYSPYDDDIYDDSEYDDDDYEIDD